MIKEAIEEESENVSFSMNRVEEIEISEAKQDKKVKAGVTVLESRELGD